MDDVIEVVQRISRAYDAGTEGLLADELNSVVAMLEELPAKGREAEELRAGVERVVDTYFGSDSDEVGEVVTDLQTLLDSVDARDSLAFVEAKAHFRSMRLKELNEDLLAEATFALQELGVLIRALVVATEPGIARNQIRTLQGHLASIDAGLAAVAEKID